MKINLKDGRYINLTIRQDEKGIYKYYNGNILIGVYQPNPMGNSKFLEVDLERNNTLDNELSAESKDTIKQIIEEVKEQIEGLDLEIIEEEAKETKALEEYLQEVGIDRKKVKSMTVMDLDRKKQKEPEKQDKKEEQKKSKTVVPTTKDVNIKQEIDIEERATDVQDFKRWLGGKIPNEIQKVGVIESEEMSKLKDEKGKPMSEPSTRFALVTINNKKEVEPLKKYIPQLEQNTVSGNNPRQDSYQIDTDGSVEKDAVLSEYRIGSKILQLDKDYGDHVEVNIGKYSPFNNEQVTTRMRDKNTTFPTDIETRRAAQGHYEGVYESTKSYQEAKQHEEAGCEPEDLTQKEIDGEEDTGHQHFTQEQKEECVQELMKDETISEVFTEEEVRQRLEKNILQKENTRRDEIKEQTQKELEEDASHFKNR